MHFRKSSFVPFLAFLVACASDDPQSTGADPLASATLPGSTTQPSEIPSGSNPVPDSGSNPPNVSNPPSTPGLAPAMGGNPASLPPTSGMTPPGTGGSPASVPSGPSPPGTAGQPTAPTDEEPPPSLIGDVSLSTPSQTFQGALEVSLSTAVEGAEIRYTTDGSIPTAASALFDGLALSLTETTQLRAQAFVSGAPSGALTTGLYIARDFDFSSNLPILILDGYGTGKPTDKEVSFDAAVMVFEPEGGVASISSLPTLATRAGYHIRGQSSANFPQAPYKVEFWDNADADADYPVMGMPADSDWALIPPYYDRTLIRNPFVYDLGRELGLEAPRHAFAEVFLNYEGGPLQQDDYQGIYWFTETIKNNSVRTNLKQLDEEDTAPEDISGGYIFKFDQAASEEPRIECTGSDPLGGGLFGNQGNSSGTCWSDLEVVDPEPLNAEQSAWLTTYIQQFHDGLHAEPMADYTTVIDVPSFIDHMVICELTKNVDAYVRSSYYHKDRDGLLKAGPLWDYNFALGGVGAQDALPDPQDEGDTGWMYLGARNVNNWYPRLSTDPDFMAQFRTRYQELRQTLLSDAAVQQRIDALLLPLQDAAVRDFERWPVGDIITSDTGFTGGPTVATWDGQVQVMRDFLTQRLEWIDQNLP